LGDRLHIVLLAAVTLLLYWKGPLRGRLFWAAFNAALIGGTIEFIQAFVGRAALWHDFFLDLQGIALVVGFILWRGHGKTIGLITMVILAVVIPWQMRFLPAMVSAVDDCRNSFPLLADFDDPGNSVLWVDTYSAEVKISFETKGVLQITGGPPSKWPGTQMKNFPHNWTGYKELLVDARLVKSNLPRSRFAIRIDDLLGRSEKCWVTDHFVATSQWTTYSMPIVGRQLMHSERNLDLNDVDKILLFLPTSKDTIQIEFDNLRLR
jgi:hypothetical protein